MTNHQRSCSEVVERLATEAYSIETEHGNSYWKFDREKATAILHSWRERRVQELEQAIGLLTKTIALYQERSPEHNRLPVNIMQMVTDLQKKIA